MAAILKIKCQNDVHRVPLEDVTLDAVQRAVESLYPEKPAMKYVDDENDLCTLCAATFADFLSLGTRVGDKMLLRIEVTAQPTPPPVADDAPAWGGKLHGLLAGLGPLLEVLKGKGKGVCKGKGKCSEKGKHPWEHAWGSGEPCEGPPLFDVLREGAPFFNACGQGAPFGGCSRSRGVVKIAAALRQLHASGTLSAKTAAAVFVASLGKLASVVADYAGMIDLAASTNPEVVRKVLEELMPHVVGVEGLEQCEAQMRELLLSGDVKASEALLHLLTSLDALPFCSRVSFLEGVYASTQSRIDDLLVQAGPFLASLPRVEAEHSHVACDGCQMCPLVGPRFRCKTRDDYDLCAACFASKDAIDGGECVGHEFEMIIRTDRAAGKGWWLEKGKGKGKGKWKGKRAEAAHQPEGEAAEPEKAKVAEVAHQPEGGATETERGKRCASEGCQFMTTWHPTYCCAACGVRGPDKHGPHCQRVCCSAAQEATDATAAIGQPQSDAVDDTWVTIEAPQRSADPSASAEAAREPAALEPGEPTESKQKFDLSIPVVFEDGRRLAIEWSVGDDIQQVAQEFAEEHNIPPGELPTTIQVILASVASARGQNAQ